MELRRPSWLREHATAPIAIAYLIAASLLGAKEAWVATRLFGELASPLASSSAEAILSAIASGMMAFTAILFSLLFVAIQVGGSFFGPRLVRFLGRTKLLGHALGVFAGTFVYALLAIRTIDIRERPGIDISVVVFALLWLFGSIIVLLVLILRLRRLEISGLLATLYEQTERAAVRVYAPATPGEPTEREQAPSAEGAAGSTGAIIRYGGRPQYLLGFEVDRLVRRAAEAECVIHLPLAIGDPVVAGDALAIVSPAARAIDATAVRDALWLGPQQLIDNDPAYGIRLLVDVAIRALSPAVNDPTTAVTVLDQLEGLLRVLATRRLEDHRVRDARGDVRLVFDVRGWDDLVALALAEIDQYGRDSRQVQHRITSLLDDLEHMVPAARRAAIARFASRRCAGEVPASTSPPRGPAHRGSPPRPNRGEVRGSLTDE